MIQEKQSLGGEGRLAPAWVEGHSRSGGKPPFPTMRLLLLNHFTETQALADLLS